MRAGGGHHAQPLRRPRPRGARCTRSRPPSTTCGRPSTGALTPCRSGSRATRSSPWCSAFSPANASESGSRTTSRTSPQASISTPRRSWSPAAVGQPWPPTRRASPHLASPCVRVDAACRRAGGDARVPLPWRRAVQSGHGLFGAWPSSLPLHRGPIRARAPPGRSGGTRSSQRPESRVPGVRRRVPRDRRRDYSLLDAEDHQLPQVDPTTLAYRPGSRALNYRSEPFMNRLQLGFTITGRIDESLAYSSYTYGDPATPIDEPTSATRRRKAWCMPGPRLPCAPRARRGGSLAPAAQHRTTDMISGVDKNPSITPGPSERTIARASGHPRPSTWNTSARPAAASREPATT